jgi:hypothetical protein
VDRVWVGATPPTHVPPMMGTDGLRKARLALCAAFVGIGVALIVASVVRSDAGRSVLGVVFVGAGIARFAMERRRPE